MNLVLQMQKYLEKNKISLEILKMGGIMDIEMVKFEEISCGWNIEFDVKLTHEEVSKFNMGPLEHVGDYEIQLKNNIISFKCLFDRGELGENEKIEERLELIKIDIANLAKSSLQLP